MRAGTAAPGACVAHQPAVTKPRRTPEVLHARPPPDRRRRPGPPARTEGRAVRGAVRPRDAQRGAVRAARRRSAVAAHAGRGVRGGGGARAVSERRSGTPVRARRRPLRPGRRGAPVRGVQRRSRRSGCSSTAPKAGRRSGERGAPDGRRARAHAAARRPISRREYFAREKERIFCREWVCVGREEELAAPGDYVVKDVAGESILLVRTRDGRAPAAHYNVCRHRGSQLVPECGAGRFAGRHPLSLPLLDLPLDGRAPHRALPRGVRRARPGRRSRCIRSGVDTLGRVRLRAAHAPRKRRRGALARQLSSARAERLRRYPLAELRVARRIEYPVAANWKVMLENYNECYHCGPVHPELCRLVPAFKQRGGVGARLGAGHPAPRGRLDLHRQRHHHPGAVRRARRRRAGPPQGRADLSQLPAEPVAPITWRRSWSCPHGPERTTIVCEFLFHPDEMAKPGLRSERRGGVLGPGEPAGLGDLRVGAAGHELARVPVPATTRRWRAGASTSGATSASGSAERRTGGPRRPALVNARPWSSTGLVLTDRLTACPPEEQGERAGDRQ